MFSFFLYSFRVFKRVLPLPNGSWNAIVDDWCCHPDPFASKKLLPRADDCLLGDTFVLLARDSSCTQTLTEEVSPVGTADRQEQKVRGGAHVHSSVGFFPESNTGVLNVLCSIVTHTDVQESNSSSTQVHHQQQMRIDPSTLSLIILRMNGIVKSPTKSRKTICIPFSVPPLCCSYLGFKITSFKED